MNSNIVPAEIVTIETIKDIFKSAYYETKPLVINGEEEMNSTIVDMPIVNIIIQLYAEHQYLLLSTYYVPKEQSLEKLFKVVNYLNRKYLWAKFIVDEEDDDEYGINATFTLNHKGGLNPFRLVDSLRTFHDAVGMAMGENVDAAVENRIEE
jgi:hypothetical protein